MIQNFRDLRVWQMAMQLAESVYHLTECFPRQEMFGLASQMQRAAVSIPSNIAEGHARDSRNEYLHFLSIAKGSLAELHTQLELAQRLGYITHEQAERSLEYGLAVAKQLNALRNALTTN